MAKLLKLRRGTTSQHSSFTGAEGEVTVDTDKESLVVHNGSTAGGFALARADNPDSQKTRWGDGNDLEIYHDGNSRIKNNTGALTILADDINVSNAANNEQLATFTVNSSCELFFDHSKKFETTSAGVQVTGDFKILNGGDDIFFDASENWMRWDDNVKIQCGNSGDLQIFHNGTKNWIEAHNGDLGIAVNSGNEVAANFITNGAVELYHNNFKSFQTDSHGAVIYAPEGGSANVYIYADEGDDNADKWRLQSSTNGSFYIDNYTSGSWENNIKATGNGAVELYYDNAKKIETTSTGATITGSSHSLYIKRDGSATQQTGIKFYDGGNAEAELISWSSNLKLKTGGDNAITCNNDGSVELYHNNSKKLETTSDGVSLTGHLSLGDSERIKFGDDNDCNLLHDNQHFYLNNYKNNTYIQAPNNVSLATTDSSGSAQEISGIFSRNGSCELRYDNVKKFETSSAGVNIGLGRWGNFENSSTNPNLQVSGTDLNGSCQAWIRATADAGAPKLFIANTRSTSAGGHGAVLNGDELGGIYFAGSDGSEFVNGAAITAWVHNTPGANDMPGSLYFSTTNDSSASLTLRQKITAYGEVWFNSSSATYGETYKFHNHREDDGMFIYQASTNDYSGIICRHGRGLSGYSGVMFNFKRNDGATVGTIHIGASSTSYNTSSDYRLKENQVTIANASAKVNQLKPYEFNFKDDPDYKHLGFFAHEVQEVLPQVGIVTGTKDAVEEDGSIKAQSVDYSKLTPILTAALQEALAEIATLKTKVAALEAG